MANITHIIRHKKENKKKCSLRGLETSEAFKFYSYPLKRDLDITPFIMLTIDAEPLTAEDNTSPLLFIDGTWRYAAIMEQTLTSGIIIERRSIPTGFKTAYPRKQTFCIDEERGLATIEAIYVAHTILGKNTNTLFDNYYFGNAFLELNAHLLKKISNKN